MLAPTMTLKLVVDTTTKKDDWVGTWRRRGLSIFIVQPSKKILQATIQSTNPELNAKTGIFHPKFEGKVCPTGRIDSLHATLTMLTSILPLSNKIQVVEFKVDDLGSVRLNKVTK